MPTFNSCNECVGSLGMIHERAIIDACNLFYDFIITCFCCCYTLMPYVQCTTFVKQFYSKYTFYYHYLYDRTPACHRVSCARMCCASYVVCRPITGRDYFEEFHIHFISSFMLSVSSAYFKKALLLTCLSHP